MPSVANIWTLRWPDGVGLCSVVQRVEEGGRRVLCGQVGGALGQGKGRRGGGSGLGGGRISSDGKH